MRAAGIALLLVLLALVARDATRSLIVDAGAVAYRFELDYGEGPILAQTLDWMRGRAVYAPIDGPPYRITNYPPVFHLLSAGVATVAGDVLAAGRAVSLASTLLTAGAIALLVWRAVAQGASPLLRGLAAALAALSFLRVSYTATWAPLMRVDMLANFLSFGGVLAFAWARSERRKILICAPILVLALFTRQSAVAAAAACVVVAYFARPSLALRLGLAYVLCGAVALVVLLVATGGWFWFHIATANVNAYDWQRAAAYLQDAARSHPVEIAVALVALRSLLGGLRELGSSAAPPAWVRPLLGVYLLTSLLVSSTVGKLGSEVNYLVEFMGVVSACFAVAVADSLAGSLSGSLGAKLAALALPGLLLAEAVWLAPSPAPEWQDVWDARGRDEAAQVLERIERTDGPVLSEDMTLLVLAGKEIVYQPFEMTQLARQGVWRPDAFLRSLERGEFGLVVLRFDIESPPWWELERFSAEMLRAMRRGYVRSGRIGGYRLYEPKDTQSQSQKEGSRLRAPGSKSE